jgi:hypothetical protein
MIFAVSVILGILMGIFSHLFDLSLHSSYEAICLRSVLVSGFYLTLPYFILPAPLRIARTPKAATEVKKETR